MKDLAAQLRERCDMWGRVGVGFEHLDCAPVAGPHVYLAWGPAGDVLYVGASRRLRARLQEHRRRAPWADETDTLTWERFATLDEALMAEALLISELAPTYNRVRPLPVR